jgi:hypothetical protein
MAELFPPQPRRAVRRRPAMGDALDPAVIKLVDALARALARDDDAREREAQVVASAPGETNQ